jgi:hypothetical protein
VEDEVNDVVRDPVPVLDLDLESIDMDEEKV